MLSDRDAGTLRDMLHCVTCAQEFVGGQTFDTLRADLMRLYAVTRCLEFISEASRRLSPELKAGLSGDPLAADGGRGELLPP